MSDAYLGEIRLVPYVNATPPQGWLMCNGQLLSISQYQTLFAVIGTVYGGDGNTTLGLPNLNGGIPVVQGAGPGLTPRVMGQSGGTDVVALTDAQIPAHDHAFSATTAANTTGTVGNTLLYGSDTATTYKRYVSPTPTPAPTTASFHAETISFAGANQPHANIMPGIGLRYIMCVSAGLFPVRP